MRSLTQFGAALLAVCLSLPTIAGVMVTSGGGNPGEEIILDMTFQNQTGNVQTFTVQLDFDNSQMEVTVSNCSDINGVSLTCQTNGDDSIVLTASGDGPLPNFSIGTLNVNIRSDARSPDLARIVVGDHDYMDEEGNLIPDESSLTGRVEITNGQETN